MSFVPRSVHAEGGASEFINARQRNKMAPKRKGKKGKKGRRSTQATVAYVKHRNMDGPLISYDAVEAPVYRQPRTEAEARNVWAEAVKRVQEARGPKHSKSNAEAEVYGDRWAFLYDNDFFPYAEDEEDYPQYTKEGRARAARDATQATMYAERDANRAARELVSQRNPFDSS